jgi:hypothetical protein
VVSKKDFSSLLGGIAASGHRVIGSAIAFSLEFLWLDAPDIPITVHRASVEARVLFLNVFLSVF